MVTFPEVNERKNLVAFLAFAQIGIGVTEDVTAGILGQKYQDAGLAATAHGHVMPLHQGVFSVIGDGMKVQVEGLSRQEIMAMDLFVPGGQEAGGFAVIDSGGILREVTFLGKGV